ncbi:MAG: right-handed parallel beta-helix repeat-containing protein, partial [Desulfobulbaceae bacterium]|nr:right-handed parallel beta-helix repeat-containing protein [Desulfobulbaceae bacterium]
LLDLLHIGSFSRLPFLRAFFTLFSLCIFSLSFNSFNLHSCFAAATANNKKIEPASVIIEDNKVFQNDLTGIRLSGTTPVIIKSCEVSENGRAGILIRKKVRVNIYDTTIYENGRGGIDVINADLLEINRIRVFKNAMGGIRLQKQRGENTVAVSIENSTIFSNMEAGLRSMPLPKTGVGKVELVLNNNKIYQNDKAGIRVENRTWLLAKNNNVYNNGTAGIIAHDSEIVPEIDIYRNRISGNIGPGIHIYTGKNGKMGISNNYIYNNERSGVICALRDTAVSRLIDIDVVNNTIVGNGSVDQGAGVRNDSNGKVRIYNNIIAYNYVTGIRTKGCGDFGNNLLYANGHVANCCEDPEFAPFYIEKVQFAGCAGRGPGGLIADPLFVNADVYNFDLQPSSPALHRGLDIWAKGKDEHQIYDIGATGDHYIVR